jgi:hypothetical protein
MGCFGGDGLGAKAVDCFFRCLRLVFDVGVRAAEVGKAHGEAAVRFRPEDGGVGKREH